MICRRYYIWKEKWNKKNSFPDLIGKEINFKNYNSFFWKFAALRMLK